MAGPFHHDIRRDADGKGVDYEGAAAGVGADEFPFRMNLILAFIAFVGCDSDFLVNSGKLAQLFDIAVHRLVGVNRKGIIIIGAFSEVLGAQRISEIPSAF